MISKKKMYIYIISTLLLIILLLFLLLVKQLYFLPKIESLEEKLNDVFSLNDTLEKNKLILEDEIGDLENEYDKLISIKNKYVKLNLEKQIEELKKTTSAYNEKINSLEDENNNLLIELNNVKKEYDNLSNLSSYQISNFPTYNQNLKYPTGCESVSLYLLLKYEGVNVSIDQIIGRLKKGSYPYLEKGVLYGGNPYVEFVGDPRSNSGYGVFAKPIEDVGNYYKSGIVNATGKSLSQILKIVRKGHPVQVWVSIGMVLPYVSNSWIYKETGETIQWKANEHSLVVIGYSDTEVIVSDPIGGKIKRYNKQVFENRYNYFGKQALYYE